MRQEFSEQMRDFKKENMITMNKLITGANTIIYSKDAEADRVFLHDVLGLANVDAGEG